LFKTGRALLEERSRCGSELAEIENGPQSPGKGDNSGIGDNQACSLVKRLYYHAGKKKRKKKRMSKKLNVKEGTNAIRLT